MDHDLDDLFKAARAARPEPSPALLARVLADAEAAQAPPPARRDTRWRFVPLLLGSVGASLGMATAALAGVWIGYAQPDTLTSVTAALWVDQRIDLIPTYDFTTE